MLTVVTLTLNFLELNMRVPLSSFCGFICALMLCLPLPARAGESTPDTLPRSRVGFIIAGGIMAGVGAGFFIGGLSGVLEPPCTLYGDAYYGYYEVCSIQPQDVAAAIAGPALLGVGIPFLCGGLDREVTRADWARAHRGDLSLQISLAPRRRSGYIGLRGNF